MNCVKRFLSMAMICEPLLYCKYGNELIYKTYVPNERKSWTVEYDSYRPTNFSVDFTGKSYADPNIGDPNFDPKWNQIDGKIDRKSYNGDYRIVEGYPLNPLGRTGMRLRGLLGRWGPNKAADPIVTRWKRDKNGSVMKHPISKLPILQFVAIQRRDTGDWAIPGGMVDPGEHVSATVKREFFEEALNSLQLSKEERESTEKKLNKFFESGIEIYRGCVNDPRNTDNSWMETVAFNFHDESGDIIGNVDLTAGDDAKSVQWNDIDKSLKLYANHIDFIQKTAEKLGAHL